MIGGMSNKELRLALRSAGRHGLMVTLFGMGAGLFWAVSSAGKGVAKSSTFLVSATGGVLAVGIWIGAALWWAKQGCNLREALVYDSWSYVIWLGPILFVPVYLAASDHPALTPGVSIQILFTALLLWLVLKAVLFSECAEKWSAFLERHTVLCLSTLVFFYIVMAALLSWRKWQVFTLGDVDTAIIWQSLAYTLRGEGFFYNTIEAIGHFGVHNSPVLVLLLPLYAVWPDPRAIIILNPVLIGLSGIPFFLLARDRLRSALPALVLTVAYLLYPSVAYRAIADFHEMTILPLFLLLAFLAFEQERLGWFVMALLLSLAVKETIALTTLVFAVYALIRRRRWSWIAIPLVLSMVSLWLSFAVVMPMEAKRTTHYMARVVFGSLGETPIDVIRYALHSPVSFARSTVTIRKLAFVFQVLQPAGIILPVLSPIGLFALPAVGLSFITQMGSVGIRGWESVIFGPIVFLATVDVIARSCLFARLKYLETRRCLAYLSCVVLGLTLVCVPYWLRAYEYRFAPYYEAQKKAVTVIPPGVSVSVPSYMTARFADRRYIQLPTGFPFYADYHLVDIHWVHTQRGHQLTLRAAEDYMDIWTNAEYGEVYRGLELLWRDDGFAVYRRARR